MQNNTLNMQLSGLHVIRAFYVKKQFKRRHLLQQRTVHRPTHVPLGGLAEHFIIIKSVAICSGYQAVP